MVMKSKRNKTNLHDSLIAQGFTLEKVVETHSKLPKQTKKYSDKVEYGEIDTFTIVPGRLVPEVRPDKLSRKFYDNNSFAIYIREYP